jgi:hypothetical protein
MPTPETDYRFQTCNMWPRVGDDSYGNPLLGEPQTIKVRWENKQIEMIDPKGQPIRLDALVITVDTIPMGSILLLSGSTDYMEAVAYDNIPDVKGRVFRKTVGLKRYQDALPEVVS